MRANVRAKKGICGLPGGRIDAHEVGHILGAVVSTARLVKKENRVCRRGRRRRSTLRRHRDVQGAGQGCESRHEIDAIYKTKLAARDG